MWYMPRNKALLGDSKDDPNEVYIDAIHLFFMQNHLNVSDSPHFSITLEIDISVSHSRMWMKAFFL